MASGGTETYVEKDQDMEQKKPIDRRLTFNIVNYNIEYPLCYYSYNSRRNYVPKKLSLADKLKSLDGWNNFDTIAIDGQNGTTKSTLCKILMRTYRKINDVIPEITCGSNYNFEPLRSMEYLCAQLSIESHDSVWDRCPYSNLIFYFVHQLMYEFRHGTIPKEAKSVWPKLNKLALNTNLVNTINFCKTFKNIPTIFFVCLDVDYISNSLCQRAINTHSLNDLWNSKEYNYQMAQYHAYTWFGKLLNYPVFDLNDFFEEKFGINDMHTIIASKIDRPPQNNTCILPDRTHSKLLNTLLNPMMDDVLIYDYSKK